MDALLRFPGWGSLFLCGIASITEITICYFLFKYSRNLKYKQLGNIGFTCILFYFFYSFLYVILSLYGLTINPNSFSHWTCVILWFAPALFSIAQILVYIFLLIQLYFIFRGSAYEYSKTFIKIFCVIIIISFSCSMIPASTYVMTSYQSYSKQYSFNDIKSFADCTNITKNNDKYNILIGLTIGLNLFSEFLLTIIILRLYLKNLILLSLTCGELETKINTKSNKKRIDIKNHRKNALFLALSVKITNIVLIITFSSYLGILIFSRSVFGQWWCTIDHLINSICIFMTFKFGDGIYQCVCPCQRACYPFMAKCCFCCCMASIKDEVKVFIDMKTKTKHRRKDKSDGRDDTSTAASVSSNDSCIIPALFGNADLPLADLSLSSIEFSS